MRIEKSSTGATLGYVLAELQDCNSNFLGIEAELGEVQEKKVLGGSVEYTWTGHVFFFLKWQMLCRTSMTEPQWCSQTGQRGVHTDG